MRGNLLIMDVNNSNLIVSERAPKINHLQFNALSNKSKYLNEVMASKEEQKLLNDSVKPMIMPKKNVTNGSANIVRSSSVGSKTDIKDVIKSPTIASKSVHAINIPATSSSLGTVNTPPKQSKPVRNETAKNSSNIVATSQKDSKFNNVNNDSTKESEKICDKKEDEVQETGDKNSRLSKISAQLPNLIPPTHFSTALSNPYLVHLNQSYASPPGSFNVRNNSFRIPRYGFQDEFRSPSVYFGRPGSDSSSQISKQYSDAASVRSLASVGMGCTDGRKMIIRRIPTSPVELFNIVNPPTPPEEYLYDADSLDGSEDADSIYHKPRRQYWSNKLQFVLACIGYSVGLGSVWRFPYLCYQSGGGVFLIPYFIIMVICGIPLLYMELAVGQFTGRGPIGAIGQLCPLFKGAGLASVVISFLMSTYYSVIIAYGIYYFFSSFKPIQPWEDCSNRWNTAKCWVPERLRLNHSKPYSSRTPAAEFYDDKVLQLSKGIEYPGILRWELVACLVCAWVLVYFAIWKSIKSSAKARYFTATLPFVLIIVFLAKSLTLEGADKGMRYFFKPNWQLLGESQVWVNAAAQTFNSMGIGFGSMICFARYNKFNNNILHDTLAVSFVNLITSLLVGIFAFATIGNIATEHNTSIEDVIADGPGLIFVVYPQAMAKMPAAQVWAVLFFFMLLCLGLNSQFAIVEVVVTSIQDGFPSWIRKRFLCHELLVLGICVISFLCGLPNVTQGGIYFFQLMDHYAAHISIMYLAFFEVIAVAWCYGVHRLSKNVEMMTGHQPSIYFKFCWMVAGPMLMFAVWVFCLIDYETPTYNNEQYHYPLWAIIMGWFISSLSILCIPVYAVCIFIKSEGETWVEKLKNSLKPRLFECEKCGQHDCDHLEEMRENEMKPMFVLGTSDIKASSSTATPSSVRNNYTPLSNSPLVNRVNDIGTVESNEMGRNVQGR